MRRRGNERGNALVEFAIGAAVLVLAFTGIFQFGYAFYVYNNVLAAVDNGARYAANLTYDSADSTPSSTYLAAVQNMVVYGQSTAGTTTLAPGLATSQVNVAVTFDSSKPSSVQVSLQNYPLNAIFTTFTMSKPAISYPYMGTYAP